MFDAVWLETSRHACTRRPDAADSSGDALLHGDVRSDNLCFRDGRAVLVDWNWACRGRPLLDVAAWLPSLHHEGGPEPWTILPGQGALAALLAGFFLEHAGREPIPQAPHVRRLQLDQGRVALRVGLPRAGHPRPQLSAAGSCTCNTLLHSPAMGTAPVDYADVLDLLRSRGLRMTPQRRAIVSEVMRTQGHISPAAIARTIEGEMPGVNPSTVYRTLTLARGGRACCSIPTSSRAPSTTRRDEAQHVHLTCHRCGRDDALSIAEAKRSGS